MAPAMPSVTARSGGIIVGLGLAAYLFATQAVSWKDLLKDQAAWDTVIWFSVIISLASGLSSLGFISWMTTKLETTISGFGATAIAAGAPPMMVAICFGIFSNLMWGNTEYGGGSGPIYFAQGYFEQPRFYRINFCVVTFNVILIFVVGRAWWKLLGYY